MIDEPDSRKIHRRAIPRVGGTGIVIGSLFPIALFLEWDPLVQAYLAGSLIIFLFGIWDDISQLNARIKFLGQLIAASIVIFHGNLWIENFPLMNMYSISAGFGIPFTFFAICGMVNAINTSDGLDGLAGGESILSLLVIAFLASLAEGQVAVFISLAVIGSILGFLRYNTHPAQIFMGDVGSQFLGFTLGFLAVLLTQRVHPALSPASTLFFLGLPVIDILTVMGRRIYQGKKIFQADRGHLHHRLLDLGFSHHETVIISYALHALLVINAVFLRYEEDALILIVYAGFVVLLYGLLYFAEKNGWKTKGTSIIFGQAYGHLSWLRKDVLCILPARFVSIAVPTYIFAGSLLASNVPHDFGVISAVLFVITLAVLVFGKYRADLILRGVTHVTAIFVVYLTMDFPMTLDTIFFSSLAIAIVLTVKFATEVKFKITPMDYLMLFTVIMLGIFGKGFLGAREVVILLLEGMILLYGCEVVIDRSRQRWNCLNVSVATALGILSLRGLLL
jgi:UDP-GlcNAc:undecaprenyl-phosphate GlcNAc-1-phosphate transferase